MTTKAPIKNAQDGKAKPSEILAQARRLGVCSGESSVALIRADRDRDG
jgi:hypothetical protein